MPNTGVKYPATVSTIQETGDDNNWVSPSSVGADDAAYASITAATFDAGDVSYLLRATNLSMGVPTASTIDGILVEIERYYAGGLVEDVDVVLTKDGINRVGSDYSTGADFTTSPAIVSFGGATNKWGTTWTPAEVNATTFGVFYKMGAVGNNADGFVDFIRVTVYYTAWVVPTVETVGAPGVGPTTATLQGNITATGGENPTVRGFDYGTTISYGSAVTESGSFDVGYYELQATGLTANTLYHFRAKAQNSMGWGYGADMEFTTPAAGSTETLRPDATGDEENIPFSTSGAGLHWSDVDEAVSDSDTTRVYKSSVDDNWTRDLYNLPPHTGTGTINSITVYANCRASATATQTGLKIAIKTGGTAYEGSEQTIAGSYTLYSSQWTVNPQTSAAWTWAQIDALQIGENLRRSGGTINSLCTQVYVVVDYTAAPILKIINETEQLNEALIKARSLVRRIAETEQLTEALIKARSLVRRIAETIQLAEGIVRLKAMTRIINETSQIIEGIIRRKTMTRIINETEQLTEAQNRRKSIVRIIAETEQLNEALIKARSLVRRIAEALEIIEGIIRRKTMTRIINETISLLETRLKPRSSATSRGASDRQHKGRNFY